MVRGGQTRAVRRHHHPVPDHDVRSTAFFEWVRSGLWLIPLVSMAAAVGLAALLALVDEHWPDLPSAFHGDASSAQDLLSTIATVTTTVTTLVLSITIVALQLASQQFSPRVMRTFFRDTGTKVSLGIFLATTVYALFVLRGVVPRGLGKTEFVPGVSITVAFGLTVLTLLTFVYYLNHVTHAIRVVHILDAVAAETRVLVGALPAAAPDQVRAGDLPDREADLVLGSDQRPGVLVLIDEDDVVSLAERQGVRLRFLRRVGDHLPSGIPLVEVWSDDGDAPQITARELVRFTGIANERTMGQDIAFGFRQLVDIAEKALSPALNDPTTAVQAIDRIHDLLRRLALKPDADGRYRGGDGTVRLTVPMYRWPDYARLAFDEIRHYGADSVQVHQRLRAALDDLATVVADTPDRRAVIDGQLRALDRSADAQFPYAVDRQRAGVAHLAG